MERIHIRVTETDCQIKVLRGPTNDAKFSARIGGRPMLSEI